MKKVMFVLGMSVLVSLASQAQDKKAATPAATPSVISGDSAEFKFKEDEFSFGTINQGESVTHEFEFTNTGKQPLIITEAHGSCGCTVPEWPHDAVKKGENQKIKVTFNSTGKSGMQDKTVTINSNAKGGSKVLHLRGTVNVPAKKEEGKK